jgi:histidine kinase/DNA gyrase B/HSP90-like ATPase
MKEGNEMGDLSRKLVEITSAGIQADDSRMRTDMSAQFSNPNEWTREYAVNGADADATKIHISAYGNGKTMTVVVEDDGCGMDKEGVKGFCRIFRSRKRGGAKRKVGTHGIGKLSPAAVPGQCGFLMITSTGTECWRMKAGCLLESTPIILEQMDSVPPKGTRFEITFENRNGSTPASKLKEYASLLKRYLRHFGLTVVLFEIDGKDPEHPTWAKPVARIEGDWETPAEKAGRSYSFKFGSKHFHIVVGLGSGEHEVYQNRVLVTTKYNLLSHDLSSELLVKHLKIRVDSPHFELSFGRNGLLNGAVLAHVSRFIRRKVLPEYFEELLILREEGRLKEQGVTFKELDEMACSLLLHRETVDNGSWRHLPVFPALNMNSKRLSFAQLAREVRKQGFFYLEIQTVPGTDYSAMGAPVISGALPDEGLAVLKKHFQKEMILLGRDDTILEKAQPEGANLNEKEKNFEKCLGFGSAALNSSIRQKNSSGKKNGKQKRIMPLRKLGQIKGALKEGMSAASDLASLKWRVSYLVHRDGKTPCRTHRFILRHNAVILNLNHPEVKRLIRFSEEDAALAGHWATAMCLCDESRVLDHITPEKRDDLLMLDAIGKVEGPEIHESKKSSQRPTSEGFSDFLRNAEELDSWSR